MVPLSLRYLGSEQYGLWMTVTSVTAMLAFADFGMGNGLLNAIASADGRDDVDAAISATSSAVFLLTGVAILLAGLFWISYPFVPWHRVLNASKPELAGVAGRVVAVTLMCAFLSLPLGTIQRIQMGYQEGYLNGVWKGAGSALGLLALVVSIHRGATLPWLVCCLAGAPVVALAANGYVLFGYRRPRLRPRWSSVSATTTAELLGTGSLFFAIQLAGVVGYELPTLAIAHLRGPAEVTTFTVAFRLFMVMPALMGFFLTPLWPAYREALARGDISWVKRGVGISTAIGLAANVAWGSCLLLFGPAILRWWVGPQVVAPFGLRLGLALWATLTGLGGPFAMFLNGAGALKFQAACAWLMALASVALSVLLIPILGIMGAAYAMVVAQTAFILVPSLFYVPRLMKSLAVDAAGHPAIAVTTDAAEEIAPGYEGAW